MVSSGRGFEGGGHRTSRHTEWVLWGVRTRGLFLLLQSRAGFQGDPADLELGGGGFWAPLAGSPALWLHWEPEWALGEGEVGSPPSPHTPYGFWQETHRGEALRVLQMWKVLLSEGEPPGARSPELYEPLRTGTCVLAQVLVGRGTWPVFLPSGRGPQETALDGTVDSGELQRPWLPPSWCPGITGGDTGPKSGKEAFWVCLPGPWALEKGITVGGGCWERERPLGHTLHPTDWPMW